MNPGTHPAIVPQRQHSEGDDINLFELANALLRRWRLVLGLPLAAGATTAGISLLLEPIYAATTAFVPESGAQRGFPSQLAGIAGQFGLSLGTEGSESPQFYAEVLHSRELIDRVLLSRFPDPRLQLEPQDSTTLLSLLGSEGESLADSLSRGRRILEQNLSVRADNRTNIVRLQVESRYADLAAAVANRFVAYLNQFNAESRQSRGRERRQFVEGRIQEAEKELRVAEEALRLFYERNRRWQDSPQLVVEEDRLRRQVQIRQELYLTLQREYETARVEEVNDTPVITVIDRAIPPTKRSRPRRTLLVMLGMLLGAMAGVVVSVAADALHSTKFEEDKHYRAFRESMEAIRSKMFPWRRSPGARRE